MQQFQHLRLGPHKGLEITELLDLGRINVICGPNNSGKTTILECIASEELRSAGLTADSDMAERLANQSVHAAGWQTGHPHPNDEKYMRLVGNALDTRPRWFAREAQELWNEIESGWGQNVGTYARPESQLQNWFVREFE